MMDNVKVIPNNDERDGCDKNRIIKTKNQTIGTNNNTKKESTIIPEQFENKIPAHTTNAQNEEPNHRRAI